jgi:hypothetical protein
MDIYWRLNGANVYCVWLMFLGFRSRVPPFVRGLRAIGSYTLTMLTYTSMSIRFYTFVNIANIYIEKTSGCIVSVNFSVHKVFIMH